MSGRANLRTTNVDLTKQLMQDKKKTFGILRQNFAAVTTGINSLSGISGGGQPIEGQGGLLKTSGDTMIGPLAFFRRNTGASSTPDAGNDHTLDISNTSDSYTSHVVWSTGGSNEMHIIKGAAFTGQILVIESTETLTQIIRDESTVATVGRNIKTLDGNDLTLGTRKTLVLFMFSDIDNFWHQISNPIVGGAGISPGDNVTWTGTHTFTAAIHNINSASIRLGDAITDEINFLGRANTDLIPITNSAFNLGTSGRNWDELYVNRIASTVTFTGATTNINSSTINLGDSISDTINVLGRIGVDVDPDSDATRDLGSASLRWANITGVSGIFSVVTASVSLVANGSTFLGNSTSDTITFTGRINSDFDPNSTNTRDMGSSGLRWAKIWAQSADFSNSGADAIIISAGDIDLGASSYIEVGSTSTTASSGARTLPANPDGFAWFKIPGGGFRKFPYYNP